MFRLVNPVQYYAWGSTDDIPAFLGMTADGRPHAEMWIGAHASAPSIAVPASPVARTGSPSDVAPLALDRALADDPGALLGADALARFGERLPYLVKLLAAGKPLSLQVHPTAEYAREAFARERSAGVPDDERNYADDQHKPEMLIALVPTLALAGFRDPEDAARGLEAIDGPGIGGVIAALRGPGEPAERVRTAFAAALALDPGDVAGALVRIEAAGAEPGPTALGIASILVDHYADPGVVASFLLNSVELAPGEGLYVGAGVVHAYVRGFGIEVMASSDNVLRAGLTVKRVDVPELMNIVDTTPGPAHLVRPVAVEAGGVRDYDTPADDFHLVFVTAPGGADSDPVPVPSAGGPRVVVCLDGTVEAIASGGRVALGRGDVAFVGHDDGELRLGGVGTAAVVGPRA